MSESALVSTSMEFLARAASSSEVLTLNLTNLLILLVLKAIIFAFGLFSAGSSTYRSSDDAPAIQQSDVTGGMCFMMFTGGDEEKLSCVQRSACEDPNTATDYLTAAKMWYKIHKLVKVVPFSSKYYDVMIAIQEAAEHSQNGGDCSKYAW